MQYPRFVFQKGGNHHCKNGKYKERLVWNQDEMFEAVKSGWYLTPDDAISGKTYTFRSFKQEKENETEENDPCLNDLTREELEDKAKELGIGFNVKTKNIILVEKINKALSTETDPINE
jgi:hypothetical protein